MLDKETILIGYSGHAFVVVETAIENGMKIIGYSEKEMTILNPYNLLFLGFEKSKSKLHSFTTILVFSMICGSY